MAKSTKTASTQARRSSSAAGKGVRKAAKKTAKPAAAKVAAQAGARAPAAKTSHAKPDAAPAGGKLAQRHAAIWATIQRIPAGRVATYGQVADIAGFPRQPRLTAQALAHVPDGMKLPWYRVISAAGKSSLPGEAGKREQQRRLEAEGVVFDARGRVDFAVYRWRPRGDAPVLD